PTLDAGNNFGKKVRNVFLRTLDERQPLVTKKRVKETPKQIYGWLTSIRFTHDDKCGKFGTTKRIKHIDMDVKVLKHIAEELIKRKPKVCEAETMSIQPDVPI
ncbi:hypothetical protein Tco_0143289, partial [Tanacetum coccineum]